MRGRRPEFPIPTPYTIFCHDAHYSNPAARRDALYRLRVRPGSVLVTLLALLVFGYIKGLFMTGKPVRSAAQTVIVGGLAASAAFLIAKALG